MLPINRVVPPPAEGVATQNPSNSQISPAPDAMVFDGIDGILGAGRRETAAWRENWREQQLIGSNQGKAEQGAGFLQNFFHQYNIFLSCPIGSGRMWRCMRPAAAYGKQGTDGLRNFGRTVKSESFAYGENYVHRRCGATIGGWYLQKSPVGPEEFPDDSFYPVSLYCALELAMNTDTESVDRFAVRGANETEFIPLNALPFSVYQVVFLRFGKQYVLGKRKSFHGVKPSLPVFPRNARSLILKHSSACGPLPFCSL
jgi:hypothetical protein